MNTFDKNLKKETSIEKDIRINLALVVSLCLISIVIIFFYFIKLGVVDNQNFSKDSSVWGTFGDYVGGVAGTVLAFLTVFLLYKSLITQIREFFKMSSLQQKQNTDSIFFNMLGSHNNIMENIQGVVETDNNVTNNTILSGSLFIERLTHQLACLNNENGEPEQAIENLSAKRNIFRNLIIYINNVVNMIEKDIEEEDVDFYKNIFRSHLTNSELLIIAYLISNNKWSFFKEFHDKFNTFGLFKFMSLEEDVNEDTDVRIAIKSFISEPIINSVNK